MCVVVCVWRVLLSTCQDIILLKFIASVYRIVSKCYIIWFPKFQRHNENDIKSPPTTHNAQKTDITIILPWLRLNWSSPMTIATNVSILFVYWTNVWQLPLAILPIFYILILFLLWLFDCNICYWSWKNS